MLHPTAFQYLKPTDNQMTAMQLARDAAAAYAAALEAILPDGADKTYIMRHLRTLSMWANVCITRDSDGSPRKSYSKE